MTLKNIWDKNFDQFIEEWFKASGDMGNFGYINNQIKFKYI